MYACVCSMVYETVYVSEHLQYSVDSHCLQCLNICPCLVEVS